MIVFGKFFQEHLLRVFVWNVSNHQRCSGIQTCFDRLEVQNQVLALAISCISCHAVNKRIDTSQVGVVASNGPIIRCIVPRCTCEPRACSGNDRSTVWVIVVIHGLRLLVKMLLVRWWVVARAVHVCSMMAVVIIGMVLSPVLRITGMLLVHGIRIATIVSTVLRPLAVPVMHASVVMIVPSIISAIVSAHASRIVRTIGIGRFAPLHSSVVHGSTTTLSNSWLVAPST